MLTLDGSLWTKGQVWRVDMLAMFPQIKCTSKLCIFDLMKSTSWNFRSHRTWSLLGGGEVGSQKVIKVNFQTIANIQKCLSPARREVTKVTNIHETYQTRLLNSLKYQTCRDPDADIKKTEETKRRRFTFTNVHNWKEVQIFLGGGGDCSAFGVGLLLYTVQQNRANTPPQPCLQQLTYAHICTKTMNTNAQWLTPNVAPEDNVALSLFGMFKKKGVGGWGGDFLTLKKKRKWQKDVLIRKIFP